MKTNPLLQLEKSFNPFHPHWEDWKTNELNELTSKEVKLLNQKIKNGFTPNVHDHIWHRKRSEQYLSLIHKLDSTFLTYQAWVIEKFQNHILSILRKDFEKLPDEPLEHLPISNKLIGILKRFEHETIKKIFSNIHEKDFRKPQYFSIVLDYTATSSFFGQHNKSLRKEVATKN